jgi:hypothetical protein
MKFTLADVLDSYVVIYNHSEAVSYMWGDASNVNAVQLYWNNEETSFYADSSQVVEADGDYFTVKDEDGKLWQFQAMTTVRLNEVPELR